MLTYISSGAALLVGDEHRSVRLIRLLGDEKRRIRCVLRSLKRRENRPNSLVLRTEWHSAHWCRLQADGIASFFFLLTTGHLELRIILLVLGCRVRGESRIISHFRSQSIQFLHIAHLRLLLNCQFNHARYMDYSFDCSHSDYSYSGLTHRRFRLSPVELCQCTLSRMTEALLVRIEQQTLP